MSNEVIYKEIKRILNQYGVNIQPVDLKELFLLDLFANKDTLYRYAWIGDKVIDMVLAIYSPKLFNEEYTNNQLSRMSKDYCTNNHFEYQLKKMGLVKYIKTTNLKDIETVFEALIYIIYRDGNEQAVLNFLNKIDFFKKEEFTIEILKLDDTFTRYLVDAIEDIESILQHVKYENSVKKFQIIFSIYKKTIELAFYKFISKDIERFEFKEMFESVVRNIGLGSNLKKRNIYFILEIGEIIERLSNGINKNEKRLEMFIEPDKIQVYVEKIILPVLVQMKSLTKQ
ncbi:ribonuclease III domain-containing protein [Haloplasma contractile]|nr:ribonuclease III domain-containing protein [Haloplasma contractile]